MSEQRGVYECDGTVTLDYFNRISIFSKNMFLIKLSNIKSPNSKSKALEGVISAIPALFGMQIEGKLPISTFITFWSFFWSMSDNPPSLIVFDSVKNLQLISCFFCAPSWLGVFRCLHFRGGLWRLNYYSRECGVRTLLTARKRHHNMQQLISVCT